MDTSSGLYHFVGPKQQKFRKLTELLKYYRYSRMRVATSTIAHSCCTIRSGTAPNNYTQCCQDIIIDGSEHSSNKLPPLPPTHTRAHTHIHTHMHTHIHRSNPITYAGQEVLLLPVGQEEVNLEVFTGLYHDEDQYESSYL